MVVGWVTEAGTRKLGRVKNGRVRWTAKPMLSLGSCQNQQVTKQNKGHTNGEGWGEGWWVGGREKAN